MNKLCRPTEIYWRKDRGYPKQREKVYKTMRDISDATIT